MEKIKREIQESQQDIDSLTKEIEKLESEYNRLLQEADFLDPEISDIEKGENTNECNKDHNIPQILQHVHIVGPLNTYFTRNDRNKNAGDEVQIKKRKLDQLSKGTNRRDDIIEVKENILYENIYRLGGITAFPINDYLFNGEEELLGLRFDIISHLHNKYLTPHYVILRKMIEVDKSEQTIHKWSIYRHTLPVYVPLVEISKKLDIEKESSIVEFTHDIRQFLLNTQYKHDKFDAIARFKFENFGINNNKHVLRKILKDLSCQKLSLYITNRTGGPGYHIIDVFCTNTDIQNAIIKISGAHTDYNDDILLCENILRNCPMNDLAKTFRKVFRHLIQKNII